MFSKTNYRKDIQVLRGLAVLAVVLFHAKESYFPLGYLGVDVFFVISGFVVTPLILRIFNEQDIERGRLSNLISNLKAFYIRRFYRLAPALAVTLSISALAIFLLGSPLDHQRFARQGIATLLLVGNLGAYRYSGNYFSPAPNPLVHTWSLSVEEQIYIFLPLILMLFLLKRRNIKKVATIAFLSITGISILSFLNPTFLQPIYSRVGLSLTSLFSFYSPIDRIWQFALGGIGYLFLDKYRSPVKKFSKPLNLFFLFGMLMILFAPLTVSLKFSSILASFIAVGIIISRSIDVLPEFITRKLEWLGDRSYSIYLVHMPLLYLAKISPVTSLGNSERRYIQTSVAVVASIALGSLSYSRIENRFRGRSKYGNHRVKNKLVVGLLTFVVPLSFFLTIDTGARHQYWGLERSIPQPAYAGFLDPNCSRVSNLGPPCIYLKPSATKTVLLIGDSHAAQLSQAVVDATNNQKWNSVVWTHGNCQVRFKSSISGQVSENCVEMNIQMGKWVLKNKPDVIIVSQFVFSDSSQEDLRNAIIKLKLLGPKILLIENNPIFPDGKDFMVRKPMVMPGYNPPKTFLVSAMQTKDKDASNQLAAWARDHGISTLNFNSLFCNNVICSRHSQAGWLYRDDNHLSVAGARLTIPQLETYFRSVDTS